MSNSDLQGGADKVNPFIPSVDCCDENGGARCTACDESDTKRCWGALLHSVQRPIITVPNDHHYHHRRHYYRRQSFIQTATSMTHRKKAKMAARYTLHLLQGPWVY